MIEVIYWKKYCRVKITGHAHSGEPGKDLICAGASTLAVTLATNVRYMAEMGYVMNPIVDLESGDAMIQCTPRCNYRKSVEQVFNSVCVGFDALANQYPEHIRYEVRV